MRIPVFWQSASATSGYTEGQARIQKFRLWGENVAGGSNFEGRESQSSGRRPQGVEFGKGCPLFSVGGPKIFLKFFIKNGAFWRISELGRVLCP